jgi:hypothetical protein
VIELEDSIDDGLGHQDKSMEFRLYPGLSFRDSTKTKARLKPELHASMS